MAPRDSFEVMAKKISDEERLSILGQLTPAEPSRGTHFQATGEKFDDTAEPLDIKLKKEPFLLRFFIWLKAVISNTTRSAIYNEHRLSKIAHHVQKNFPGIINPKQNTLLTPFYTHLNELKSCADFFRPHLKPLDDSEGEFYVFLSSYVMPEVTEDIKTKTSPYSNPVTSSIKPDTRSSLLRGLEESFNTLPADDKARMYQAAKAGEWLRQFVSLPLAHVVTQFTSASSNVFTCSFGQIESEIDGITQILCNAIYVPDEFLEALFMFPLHNSRNSEEDSRNAGEFLGKARANLELIRLFLKSIPIGSVTRLIHTDSQWRAPAFSGGEEWFLKYKSAWKKNFEKQWASWESDCKKEAMLSTLEMDFDLDSFPQFPERPWEGGWSRLEFPYETSLGFLNWFVREKFSVFELDLKTLLVQGTFNKKENFTMLSDSFGALVQISVSLQELERRLSANGETGSIFTKINGERSPTFQSQATLEQALRGLELDVTELIHRFGKHARTTKQVLSGILGLTNDTHLGSVSNLSSFEDKNNETFVRRLEKAHRLLESAINIVTELEILDKKKSEK